MAEGGGARSGTSPVWGLPSTTSDLPSVSFLRSSDIAQSGLARPHNRSLCLLWRRHPAWIGHHRRDVKGGPITVRSHRCCTFMALAPGGKKINLAAQACPWAHCELFHHPSVGISADGRRRYDRTRASTRRPEGSVSPGIPARQHSPFAATPRPAGSFSHATSFNCKRTRSGGLGRAGSAQGLGQFLGLQWLCVYCRCVLPGPRPVWSICSPGGSGRYS